MEETNVAEHAATASGDWAGLPGDLLTCIGELLDLPARLCFRRMCRSWRAALPAMPPPWLVIPDGWHVDDRDRFTVLSLPAREKEAFRWTLRGQRCVGSGGGWLAFVDAGLAITLLNPLTDAPPAVRLPPLGPLRRGCGSISLAAPMAPDGTLQLRASHEKRLFSKAQLSFVQRVAFAPDPSAQDYAVAVLCRDDGHGLAFTTAGAGGWRWVADWPVAAGRAAPDGEAQYVNRALDLVYHGGRFYYMTLCGTIWALDPAAPAPAAPAPVAKWRPPGPDYLLYGKHIVFTDEGALHVVWSDVPGLADDARRRPRRMHVRRYDPAAGGGGRRGTWAAGHSSSATAASRWRCRPRRRRRRRGCGQTASTTPTSPRDPTTFVTFGRTWSRRSGSSTWRPTASGCATSETCSGWIGIRPFGLPPRAGADRLQTTP
ncbi:hypothetical protein ACP4OV_026662 [Aristida adscensionis]